MVRHSVRSALFCLVLFPGLAAAEPVKLKFAYFSSDRTMTYRAAIKPFVDAVNAAGTGVVEIEVGISGTLGKGPANQLQLVRDGRADLAFIIPGYTPDQFPDTAVTELPGIFSGIREATVVYTALIDAKVLRGYDDLIVIGAFATEPESIHTRPPAASLEDLKGMRIRVNNVVQGAALTALGMVPVQMPINQASIAIGSGKLDGAMVAPSPLTEFGIARVTPNHFMLGVSSAPLAVVMSRQKFESLPEQARNVLRRFDREWTATRYIEVYRAENEKALEALKRDSNRTVVTPSASDAARARSVFKAEVEAWSASDPRHRELLMKMTEQIDKFRDRTVGRQ